jgi:hypothetical protein
VTHRPSPDQHCVHPEHCVHPDCACFAFRRVAPPAVDDRDADRAELAYRFATQGVTRAGAVAEVAELLP